MAIILNLDRLVGKLKDRQAKSIRGKVSVVVGYTQNYAIYVHENLEAHHEVGQAKFLEQPAREIAEQLGTMIASDLKSGLTISQSLLRAGLRLQRESQQLVPVDTGALKASAFTRLEQPKVV